MSVAAIDKKSMKDNHKELLQTAAGMNQALLELGVNEHATILQTLTHLHTYRVSQEQAKAVEAQQQERVNKAFSL